MLRFRILLPLLVLSAFAAFGPGVPALAPAHAALGLAPEKPDIQASLVSDVSAIAPDSEFIVALRLKMGGGWHTYWKNPGDGGLATDVKWEIPAGFTAGALEWPAPKRFETGDAVNYGYGDEVMLFTSFRAPSNLKPGGEVRIAAAARWLGCNEICIPGKANLEIKLKTAAAKSASADAPRLGAAMRKVPAPLTGWKPRAWKLGTSILLELAPLGGNRAEKTGRLYFYPDEEATIDYAAPQHLEHVEQHLRLRLEASESAPAGGPRRLRGVVAGPEGWSGKPGEAFTIDVPVEISNGKK